MSLGLIRVPHIGAKILLKNGVITRPPLREVIIFLLALKKGAIIGVRTSIRVPQRVFSPLPKTLIEFYPPLREAPKNFCGK